MKNIEHTELIERISEIVDELKTRIAKLNESGSSKKQTKEFYKTIARAHDQTMLAIERAEPVSRQKKSAKKKR
jgi:hypothetical protein